MSLVERLGEDLKAAQKSGDTDKVGVLRFVIAQIRNKEIEKRGQGKEGSLTDTEAEEVLQREVKKRRDAVELYTQGGRPELAEKENKEIELISAYLPKQLSREEVEKVINELIAGQSEFNAVMKAAMQQLKGRADGKLVGEIVKAKLGK